MQRFIPNKYEAVYQTINEVIPIEEALKSSLNKYQASDIYYMNFFKDKGNFNLNFVLTDLSVMFEYHAEPEYILEQVIKYKKYEKNEVKDRYIEVLEKALDDVRPLYITKEDKLDLSLEEMLGKLRHKLPFIYKRVREIRKFKFRFMSLLIKELTESKLPWIEVLSSALEKLIGEFEAKMKEEEKIDEVREIVILNALQKKLSNIEKK